MIINCKKKRVLIIGSSKFPVPAVLGGAVPYLIEEIIQEQDLQHGVELFCCSLWNEKAENIAKGYRNTKFIWAKVPKLVHIIDDFNTWIAKKLFRQERLLSIGFLAQVIWFTFYLGKNLKENNYDIVIFENSIPMLFSLKLFKNRQKYEDKYYIHMHSVPRKYYRNEKIFSNCKGLISISKYVANEIMSDNRVTLKPSQIKIMYNCVDTSLMRPLSNEVSFKTRQRYHIHEHEKVILFVGRLCKEKGIEEVINSIKTIKFSNLKLLIVGANFYNSNIVSPYENHLKKISKEIKNKIIFTGYVEYKDMPYLYNIADIVILPSMWEEPAGMTIIEAMACGKPIITTISGGIPEYAGKGNCILLDKENCIIDSIKRSIEKLLCDKKYCENIAQQAFFRGITYNKHFYYQQFMNIILEDGNNEKI